MTVTAMSVGEILSLPAVVDIPTAGRALGIGRSGAYALARRGDFPLPVLHLGGRRRVRTCDLRDYLGLG